MTHLIYRIRFKQFFLNPEGIKAFAERCINTYAGTRTKKKVNTLTSYVKILKEERAKHQSDFNECSKLDRMDDSSFSIRKSKSRRTKFLVYVLIIFEIFLNYLSTLIILEGDSFLLILARWAISIGVALITMLTVDNLLTKLLPEESVRVKGAGHQEAADDDLDRKTAKSKRIISLILLPIVLIAFEILIVGISNARALDIEGGQNKGMLYYGFILFSMALPVIAGYFKWDSEQHGKLYKNTLQYHKLVKLIHILNLAIVSTMKDINTIVDNRVSDAWKVFSRFKLYKENYNLKRNFSKESTEGHYCNDLQLFTVRLLDNLGNEVKDILKELQAIQK